MRFLPSNLSEFRTQLCLLSDPGNHLSERRHRYGGFDGGAVSVSPVPRSSTQLPTRPPPPPVYCLLGHTHTRGPDGVSSESQ